MKVVYVVDSISNFYQKIDLIKNRFGSNILYVVKASLMPIFSSFGLTANAVYSKNSTNVTHALLAQSKIIDDTIVCYASLKFDNKLLNTFIEKISDGEKVVNLMPKYNVFEKICNSVYNIYAKSLFKLNDHMASPKLQYLPKEFMHELIYSHFGNRLFEVEPALKKDIYIEDKQLNKSAKVKLSFSKNLIIPIIFALVSIALFFIGLAYSTSLFIVILLFVFLIILDIMLMIIFLCKQYFDKRFFK